MAKLTREKLICIGFFFFMSCSFSDGRRTLVQSHVTEGAHTLAGTETRAGLVSNTGDKTGSASGDNAEASDQTGSGGTGGGSDSCPRFTIGTGIISEPSGRFSATITVPGIGTITIPIIGVPLLPDQISKGSTTDTAASDAALQWGLNGIASSPRIREEIEAFQVPPKMTNAGPLPPDEVYGEGSMP